MSDDAESASALRDALTGLPGRELLGEHLAVAMVRAAQTDREVALLHVGLDDFRHVNEALGQAAGDELLRLVAERLAGITPPTNVVARCGGDEFCVLLADVEGEAARVAEIAAGQVAAVLRAPFEVADTELRVTASIGVSLVPGDAQDAETLLRHAETAMHDAKSDARAGVAFYAGGTQEALAQLMMTSGLARALERDEFELHYQPIVDLAGGAPVGVEALIRWRDPERGLIAPLSFIPVAEYTGLIEPIGAWVIETACAQAAAWRDGGAPLSMSCNVSLRQLRDPGFAEGVARCLRAHGLRPESLVVEITESTAMREPSCVEPILRELDEAGVRIAIDDFGTGYSSLSRLREMPVRMVKIDGSLLVGAPEGDEPSRMATAAIDLVRALDMAPVAEGVENAQQGRFVLERGCALGQGFHLGRPVPAAELARTLARR